MNICIPINEDRGMDSTVCGHFGSAPYFCIVDSESKDFRVIPNSNRHHAHGMCQPLKSLDGEAIDAIIVGGIGRGALMKLNRKQIKAYISSYSTIEETLNAFEAESLSPVTPANR